jgi:amidase
LPSAAPAGYACGVAGFAALSDYDGLGLAALVRRGEVAPIELVEEVITRIEAVNPRLGAVVAPMYDEARRVAGGPLPGGPLRGVPFLLKDLLAAYAGAPLRSGSRFFADHVPETDSELVRRYRAAGLVAVAKTATSEFGIVPFVETALHGAARNPWDPERIAGGSSGGSAAAVAARIVPIATGGDGGGSIRIPASCCGVFGLKPTRGRTPSGPDHGDLWQGAAVQHVLTRSVRDSAVVLDLSAGPDLGAPHHPPTPARPFLDEVTAEPGRLRVAFTTRPLLGGAVDPACVAAVADAAALLEQLGHDVVEAAPDVDGPAFSRAFFTMICAEVAAEVAAGERRFGRKARFGDLEVETWALRMLGERTSAPEFVAAQRTLQLAARRVAPFFETHDVLLTPTLARPPVPLGSLRARGAEAAVMKALTSVRAGRTVRLLLSLASTIERVYEFIPFTPVFNVTGQPAMSVPLYWTEAGLPVGAHFVGRFGDEATLLRLAGQLERARPWAGRVPPVHAGAAPSDMS